MLSLLSKSFQSIHCDNSPSHTNIACLFSRNREHTLVSYNDSKNSNAFDGGGASLVVLKSMESVHLPSMESTESLVMLVVASFRLTELVQQLLAVDVVVVGLG
ncbi:hypothetical protein V6N13_028362 [Hibiscus sabdariffa]